VSSLPPSDVAGAVRLVRELHHALRSRLVDVCESQSIETLSSIADDGPGDTLFAIDKVSEELIVEQLEERAASIGGLILIAEGVNDGHLCLPHAATPDSVAWRWICDPIDGTRGLMYQKRSAWILSGLAPNNGPGTSLRDIVAAVQTEVPLLKQHLSDEVWGERGSGVTARRFNRFTGDSTPLTLHPSRAPSIAQGYAMISRFFPGARDELAAIDEELVLCALGPSPPGKALCFEEQYACSGGQFYELMAGHDRFNADLRPLLAGLLAQRGVARGLCCHPYDVCTALLAEELGVILTLPDGAPLDAPLDIHADVAWVGYANAKIRAQIEPALKATLSARGYL
jgi:hypothetical protein